MILACQISFCFIIQVCATLGTTGACAFDNIKELGQICKYSDSATCANLIYSVYINADTCFCFRNEKK